MTLPLNRILCVATCILFANAVVAEETCTLGTLRGTLAWNATTSRAGVPHAASGFESYDGNGHLKYTELFSDGYTTSTFSGTGTYTIGANCIAQVTYDGGGTPFVYFVAPDGSAYYWANNQNVGTVSSGRADRVSRSLLVK
jgi:hypothetical protein